MATAQVNDVANLGGTNNLNGPLSTIPTQYLSNVRTIGSRVNGTTSGNYVPFGLFNAPATSATQYQVTPGKTFYSFALHVSYANALQIASIGFGYGTAALGGFNTGTPPTGNVIYGATSTISDALGVFLQANILTSVAYVISFPSGSYPYWRTSLGTADMGVTLLGLEL